MLVITGVGLKRCGSRLRCVGCVVAVCARMILGKLIMLCRVILIHRWLRLTGRVMRLEEIRFSLFSVKFHSVNLFLSGKKILASL